MEQKDNAKDEEKEKRKKVESLRERLAIKNGCSNYFFYLKRNITTRTARRL